MNNNINKSEYQREWEDSLGVVYFLAAGKPYRAIKIGVTKKESIEKRLRHIQSANHELIEVLGFIVFENCNKPMLRAELKEKELHKKFSHLQRFEAGWVGSEWFTADKEMLEYIKENTIPPEELSVDRTVAKPRYLKS